MSKPLVSDQLWALVASLLPAEPTKPTRVTTMSERSTAARRICLPPSVNGPPWQSHWAIIGASRSESTGPPYNRSYPVSSCTRATEQGCPQPVVVTGRVVSGYVVSRLATSLTNPMSTPGAVS